MRICIVCLRCRSTNKLPGKNRSETIGKLRAKLVAITVVITLVNVLTCQKIVTAQLFHSNNTLALTPQATCE